LLAPRRHIRALTARLFGIALLLPLALPRALAADVGYRDFSFGPTVNSTPTGEKPESKLWWNDGDWWGCLWDPGAGRYTIHRFSLGSNSWVNTGTVIDARASAKADVLWDGTHLYVLTHVFTTSAGPAPPENSGRLYRFGYDTATRTYSLDGGFPVNVNASRSETLVLTKDSTGRLWVTWVEAGKVKVNCSTGGDQTWGTPFDLPVQGGNASADDIASVAAFGTDRIGLMWSNQVDRKAYFAVHLDGSSPDQWQAREIAVGDDALGAVSDDHLHLKMACDASGAVYAATKTDLTGANDPLIYVLRRLSNGTWSRHVFGTKQDDHTRPILCIDRDAGMLHVFAQSNNAPGGRQIIYLKSASLSDLQFPGGFGTPFIDSPADAMVNNPTSTKQCVSAATGILVLASDEGTRYYLHNHLPLGGPIQQPAIVSFDPTSGPVGTQVTILGSGFTGTTEVRFGSVPSVFAVEQSTRIRATVPSGAVTGPIRVTNPAGQATSAQNFVVTTEPPPITLVFRPAHDVQVKSTSPTTNYGQEPTLRIRSENPVYQFYTKFDVTGLDGPIAQARMRLYVTDASDHGGAVHVVSNDYLGTSTPWTEDELLVGNAPEIQAAALDSLGTVELDTWVELDVSAAFGGNGTYSFACRSSSTNSAIFSSDEGGHPPELVIDRSTVAVDPITGGVRSLTLRRNHPNPFHAATAIPFDLPGASHVVLRVHDLQGRAVRRLLDRELPAGAHEVRWDGRDEAGAALPSGIYLLRLQAPGAERKRTVLILR
jgi:flagellar hook capping protein FlgD/IPT/TIG domain-containing protein